MQNERLLNDTMMQKMQITDQNMKGRSSNVNIIEKVISWRNIYSEILLVRHHLFDYLISSVHLAWVVLLKTPESIQNSNNSMILSYIMRWEIRC